MVNNDICGWFQWGECMGPGCATSEAQPHADELPLYQVAKTGTAPVVETEPSRGAKPEAAILKCPLRGHLSQ
eukprot:5488065-Prorocentrum_lima.AAC.1